MVTRKQAGAWAGLALLLGLSSLFFMLLQVSPFLPDGSRNAPAIALFVLCLTVLAFGLGSLIALWFHQRWPGLAGKVGKNKKPVAGAALRQGIWVALAVAILTVLAILQELDVILILITLGLLGLLEAYVQSRQTR